MSLTPSPTENNLKFSRKENGSNNVKENKLILMFLMTADLLMKTPHVRSFFELLCLLCFHFVGGDLKRVEKKSKNMKSKKLSH